MSLTPAIPEGLKDVSGSGLGSQSQAAPLRDFQDNTDRNGCSSTTLPVGHSEEKVGECRTMFALGALFTVYQGCRTGCLVVLPMACKELLRTTTGGAEYSPLYQLPFATWFGMDILLAVPNALFMRRYGRRPGFLVGSWGGVVGSLLAWAALRYSEGLTAYILLNCAIVILSAIGMTEFVRYAAAEACSDPQRKNITVSRVVSGAAILSMVGPLSASAASWLDRSNGFSLFFLGTAALSLIHMVAAYSLHLPPVDAMINTPDAAPRPPLLQILRRPAVLTAIVAQVSVQFSMITPMSALPLRMQSHLEHMQPADFKISGCIVLHVFCMFAPGFFTGDFINRFGLLPIMSTGLILQAVCMIASLVWSSLWGYYFAMSLLGIGWNFAFVSSTMLLLRSHTAAERTKVTSANETIRFAANGIAALVSSTLAWEALNWVCLALLVPVAVLMLFRGRT